MRSLAIAIVGLVAGMAAHIMWGTRASELTTAAGVPSAVAQASANENDLVQLRAEMRAIAREEIANARLRADQPKPPSPPPTPEQAKAAAAQRALLARAVQAGVWTDQDVVQQRNLLPQIAASERFDALRSVSRAINEGRLKVEARIAF
jgi:hypothetical protein